MLATVIIIMAVSLGAGIAVVGSLSGLALILSQFFSIFPLTNALGQVSWATSTDFILTAVPMFVMMGELLLLSGISGNLYHALGKWLGWLPGGLMHSNIASCAMFAATSGSSVATAATIGTMSTPLIKEKKYNERLFLGTLASGGTLGILIPPSIPMLVYAVVSESSVVSLYLAALIPGIIMSAGFSLIVLIFCILRPKWSGISEPFELREAISELSHLVPPILLFLLVVGSIYLGLTTPTEGAALGLVTALLLALSNGRLTWEVLGHALIRTMSVTGMITLITLAAFFLNFVLVGTGFTASIGAIVTSLDLSPLQLMLAIVVVYLILGCFMETLTMVVATTPIVLPIVTAAGFSPIWFGIVFVILLEAAMITPPVGVNLYVIQSIRKRGPILDVIMGSLPFLLMMLVVIGLLIAFPQLALWLPAVYAEAQAGG